MPMLFNKHKHMEENNQNLSKKERQELKKEEKINKQISEQKKKRLTSIFLWSFITLFVVGTITTMIVFASKNPDTKFVGGTVKAADESDWVKGASLQNIGTTPTENKNQVTLIEYSDFQCPACAAYHSVIKQLEKDFPNISIVYRHFPLPQHSNARVASQVAEAAGAQGKFWEMHDLLFENQSIWSEEKNPAGIFEAYAKKLGLNLDKFRTDANGQAGKIKIDADVQSGDKEITGTPTFFINNKKIENPRGYDEFRSIIEKAISNS
jgi:protein-disulfide isomerase